jgi:pyrroline-5-carboxylate reductase
MKIAVIGCGVMGSAFARHFAKKHAVVLCDRDPLRAQNLAQEIKATSNQSLSASIKGADFLFLAVKPNDLTEVGKELATALSADQTVMSILAGTPLSALKRYFSSNRLVRLMPNLALMNGEGVIGMTVEQLDKQMQKTLESLLQGLGLCIWLAEDKLEALTALSGSGIGFILVMIEAMIDGGVYLGFNAKDSKEIVLQTFKGAVALMRGTGKHPAELKLDISSPGGTTMAGLKVMEAEGVRSGIIHTLVASYEKALTMMKKNEK